MKKYVAMLLALLLTLGLLAGCAQTGANDAQPEQTPAQADAQPEQTAAAALFTPGTYEGSAEGLCGTVTVAVTVDESAILSVEVVKSAETAGVADPAMNQLPQQIVEHQTIALDTISGCTYASNAILEGVKAALEPVCTDMAAISKPVEKEAVSTETITDTADVIVIGSGGAGLAAASEVVDAGKSVIVIEKMSSVGGNTIRAGSALNSADPDMQRQNSMSEEEKATVRNVLATEAKNEIMQKWLDTLRQEFDAYEAEGGDYLFDSTSLHKLQTYIGGDYVGNPEMIDVFCDNTLDAIHYLEKLGVVWEKNVSIAMGATWKRSHSPEPLWGTAGSSFVLPIEKYLSDHGVEVRTGYKAEELLMENGACVGVKGTTTEGQPFELRAKSTIVATGGFSANVEMRQKYNKHWPDLGENLSTSNHPGATGDGIVMAEAAGANLVGMEWIQLVPYGSIGIPTASIDTLIFVNKEGDRFVKEDARRDVLSKAVLEQTDQTMFMIYDGHTIVDGIAAHGGTNIDALVGNGVVFKADSLEELAQQIGIDPAELTATVEAFNRAVDGEGDALGRAVFTSKIDEAPFYATRTNPTVHHTMGGIEINTNAEVLDQSGNVIPGLFAAGETTGGIHGSNRLGGNAIADIIVFGRIAGKNAVK